MDTYSPVMMTNTSTAGAGGGLAGVARESHHPSSSLVRPSTLRHGIVSEDSGSVHKSSYPLLERLQSAIRSIETRTPGRPVWTEQPTGTVEQDIALHCSPSPILEDSNLVPAKIREPVESSGVSAGDGLHPGSSAAVLTGRLGGLEYDRIERIVEDSHNRLLDSLQSSLHSLHMDMLKQCLAVQKHQEQLLYMHLPQVKELVQELRDLRDENERLRARLRLHI